MSIYTKIGDDGSTYICKNEKVPKCHPIVQLLGEFDELNSTLGICVSFLEEAMKNKKVSNKLKTIKNFLTEIQNTLFNIGSIIALDKNIQLEELTTKIETEIDLLEHEIPKLSNFILPGGASVSSFLHLSRTVCRRCERKVVELSQIKTIDKSVIKFLNRLSDYLFIAARFANTVLGYKDHEWEKDPQLY